MEKHKIIMFFAQYLGSPKDMSGSQPIIRRLQELVLREEFDASDVIRELVKQLDFCRDELSKCMAKSLVPSPIIASAINEVVNSSDPKEIETRTRIDEYFKSKTTEQLLELAEKYGLINKSEENKPTNTWIKVSDIDITTLTGHVYWAKLYRGGEPVIIDLRDTISNGHLNEAYSFNFLETHAESVLKIDVPV